MQSQPIRPYVPFANSPLYFNVPDYPRTYVPYQPQQQQQQDFSPQRAVAQIFKQYSPVQARYSPNPLSHDKPLPQPATLWDTKVHSEQQRKLLLQVIYCVLADRALPELSFHSWGNRVSILVNEASQIRDSVRDN